MTRQELQDLYDQLGPALVAYARMLTGSHAAAEDVVQQVFLKLSRFGTGVPQDSRPYLFRAVKNTALNYRRDRAREADRSQFLPAFEPSSRQNGAVPALEAALAELPEEQRQIVFLRIWGEMSIEDTAQLLNILPATAASRYRYALAKLRKRMSSYLRGHHE
jgi:RNA polymerase sigma-70 factor (ECF subfamily)